jgi:hypothetical protein
LNEGNEADSMPELDEDASTLAQGSTFVTKLHTFMNKMCTPMQQAHFVADQLSDSVSM